MFAKRLVALNMILTAFAAPALAGPAQPISSIRVVQVTSATGGTETISAGAYATTNKHGGSWIAVTVDEIGYASSRDASFAGPIPSSAITSKRLLCGNSSSPYICGTGEDSIGTEVVWRFDPVAISGNPAGTTTTFQTSASGLGSTKSTSISIRG